VALGTALALAAGIGPLACGSTSGHKSSGPTTTLVKVDRWHPPPIPAGPGIPGFCASVVSIYKHVALIPYAANQKIRMQFVHDYLSQVPTMISSAPAEIAPDARTYFTSVGQILGDLQSAGLNPKRISDPNLGQLLLDPTIKAAGDRVISYVRDNCHYTIGG
jgi:hypothetical protein